MLCFLRNSTRAYVLSVALPFLLLLLLVPAEGEKFRVVVVATRKLRTACRDVRQMYSQGVLRAGSSPKAGKKAPPFCHYLPETPAIFQEGICVRAATGYSRMERSPTFSGRKCVPSRLSDTADRIAYSLDGE